MTLFVNDSQHKIILLTHKLFMVSQTRKKKGYDDDDVE